MRKLSRSILSIHQLCQSHVRFSSHLNDISQPSTAPKSPTTSSSTTAYTAESWADEAFDGMDLSGITIVRQDPAERERRAKTKLFIETLFRVPGEQEVRDMLWAAVSNYKTLKPHHLSSMVNEARKQKYAWLRLYEGSTKSFSNDSTDITDELRKFLKRKDNGEQSMDSKRSADIPVVYPPARCLICFDAILEAGFVRLVEEQIVGSRNNGSIGESDDTKGDDLEFSTLEEARVVCSRHVEGAIKLLLEDVLREKFSDDDIIDEKSDRRNRRHDKNAHQKILSSSSEDTKNQDLKQEEGSVVNNQRTIEDAAAAWALVSTMGRHGLQLSSPKVLDALEVMLTAGIANRLNYIDEGGSSDCPELKKHKKVSYQLSVANRADFLEEQRDRIRRSQSKTKIGSGLAQVGRGVREREPSEHRI